MKILSRRRKRATSLAHCSDLSRDEAVDRLLRFLETGQMPVAEGAPIKLAAQSVCVHGDSPGAVAMAQALLDRLQAQGVTIASFLDVG